MDAAFWNNRFAAPQYIYGETPNVFVAEMASQIPAGPVRDVFDIVIARRRLEAKPQGDVAVHVPLRVQ